MAPVRVGYLGNEASYGYQAAKEAKKAGHFGRVKVDFVKFRDHADICTAVSRKKVDFGIVAIENTTDGIIHEVARAIEMLSGRNVRVRGEIVIKVDHFLMTKSGTLNGVKEIQTHESAKRQCDRKLKRLAEALNMEFDLRTLPSTGAAAENAAKDLTVAAIASKKALRDHHLRRVKEVEWKPGESFADLRDNKTRFWVLADRYAPWAEDDTKYKTCLLINLNRDACGVLSDALRYFKDKAVGLNTLYASPIPNLPWQYTFFAEISGHIDDPKVSAAYDALAEDRPLCLHPPTILGCYPDVTTTLKAGEIIGTKTQEAPTPAKYKTIAVPAMSKVTTNGDGKIGRRTSKAKSAQPTSQPKPR